MLPEVAAPEGTCDLCELSRVVRPVSLSAVVFAEVSKTVDMHMFLFDDILLLTRIKKPARKVGIVNRIHRICQHTRSLSTHARTHSCKRVHTLARAHT